eukprot:scaffold53945_cov75-Phaeocystis_antarctica.AAC.1
MPPQRLTNHARVSDVVVAEVVLDLDDARAEHYKVGKASKGEQEDDSKGQPKVAIPSCDMFAAVGVIVRWLARERIEHHRAKDDDGRL